MNAVIEDTLHIFSNLGGSNYFGLSVNGQSDSYRVNLFLASGAIGTYKWVGTHYWMENDPYASLNNFNSIKDVGQLTIVENDKLNGFVRGTFDFAVLDSVKDTIHVSEGSFRIHYQSLD